MQRRTIWKSERQFGPMTTTSISVWAFSGLPDIVPLQEIGQIKQSNQLITLSKILVFLLLTIDGRKISLWDVHKAWICVGYKGHVLQPFHRDPFSFLIMKPRIKVFTDVLTEMDTSILRVQRKQNDCRSARASRTVCGCAIKICIGPRRWPNMTFQKR
jgi:hypothetical protein